MVPFQSSYLEIGQHCGAVAKLVTVTNTQHGNFFQKYGQVDSCMVGYRSVCLRNNCRVLRMMDDRRRTLSSDINISGLFPVVNLSLY